MSADQQREGTGRHWHAIVGGCALLAVIFYFFPLFRIVALDAALEVRQSKVFDPVSYGEKFWAEELPAEAENAADITELLAALANDPEAAKAKHGRTMGSGDIHYFHVRGSGMIKEVGENTVGISVNGNDAVQVELQTGLIFSNAVRDATGLIQVSSFASSRHFNDISSDLNKRVEAEILPILREKAARGARLSFVGCAEVSDEGESLPLKVIPVAVKFE